MSEYSVNPSGIRDGLKLLERRYNGQEHRCGQDIDHNVLASRPPGWFRRTVNYLVFGKPRREYELRRERHHLHWSSDFKS